MAKNFLTINRVAEVYRPRDERIRDYREVEKLFSNEQISKQADRCMECGIPFCHGVGCPLENYIPDFNAAFRRGDFRRAWDLLSATSAMPEFTSRVCPALCEGSCTVSLNLEPVMIRQIEKRIVDYAFEHNWVTPPIPETRINRTVAIVGGGPAGMMTAHALVKLGYQITLFDRRPQIGGLLRYGIPEFKLDKGIVARRANLLTAAGVVIQPNTEIGENLTWEYLAEKFDAVVVAVGTPTPRDLTIPGRDLSGIHFALEFLGGNKISAQDRRVLIIGGGDTGSDCVGTSIRQGAKSVAQIEIMPKPPVERSASTPWPQWPYKLRTSSSHYECGDDGHSEGGIRRWNLTSREFVGENGEVKGVNVGSVNWELSPTGKPLKFADVPNSDEFLSADLIFLAMGFLKPEWKFSAPNVFIAGDAANGPSLVVRAIADAKKVAAKVHEFLSAKPD